MEDLYAIYRCQFQAHLVTPLSTEEFDSFKERREECQTLSCYFIQKIFWNICGIFNLIKVINVCETFWPYSSASLIWSTAHHINKAAACEKS